MNRVEQLRQVIDEIVRQNPDKEESRAGFIHLYGVSAICVLLALKRGLDPDLCSVAGMLHDIWNYKVGDAPEHAQLGADEAGKILHDSGSFSLEEINMICAAISRHSDKASVDGAMDELLKDADILQHYLYEPGVYERACGPVRLQRLEQVLAELGSLTSSWAGRTGNPPGHGQPLA